MKLMSKICNFSLTLPIVNYNSTAFLMSAVVRHATKRKESSGSYNILCIFGNTITTKCGMLLSFKTVFFLIYILLLRK